MAESIIRDATAEEKREWIELRTEDKRPLTWEEQFRKDLHRKEVEYASRHEPYDRIGVYKDFKKKKDEIQQKYEDYGSDAVNKIKYEDLKIDFSKYGKPDRFALLSKTDAREAPYKGAPMQLVGYHYNYQCLNHKGGIAVFVPLDVDKDRKEKVKKQVESVEKVVA